MFGLPPKPRSSYFVTSKIPTHGVVGTLNAAYALKAVRTDVTQLGVGRLDLVLIHHPAKTDAENIALWKGMEQAAVAVGETVILLTPPLHLY